MRRPPRGRVSFKVVKVDPLRRFTYTGSLLFGSARFTGDVCLVPIAPNAPTSLRSNVQSTTLVKYSFGFEWDGLLGYLINAVAKKAVVHGIEKGLLNISRIATTNSF